jgi:hypothetical protein
MNITAVRHYSPHYCDCLSVAQNGGARTFYISDFNALWRVILRESIVMLKSMLYCFLLSLDFKNVGYSVHLVSREGDNKQLGLRFE